MKDEVARIHDQLRRAHSGDAWHGPSVLTLLEDVDGARAEAHPIAGVHSIQELVAHITAWQEESVRRLEGKGRGELPPAEDWPETKDWNAVLERFKASHAALGDAILALKDPALSESVMGRNETAYVLLHGIIQHNLYHAGQIAILKKALAAV